MADIIGTLIGGNLILFFVLLILVNRFTGLFLSLIFAPQILFTGAALFVGYLFFPDQVIPYYETLWNYFYDGIVSVWTTLADLIDQFIIDLTRE